MVTLNTVFLRNNSEFASERLVGFSIAFVRHRHPGSLHRGLAILKLIVSSPLKDSMRKTIEYIHVFVYMFVHQSMWQVRADAH